MGLIEIPQAFDHRCWDLIFTNKKCRGQGDISPCTPSGQMSKLSIASGTHRKGPAAAESATGVPGPATEAEVEVPRIRQTYSFI